MNYYSRRLRWVALHTCLLLAFNRIQTGSAHFLKDDEQLYMSKFNDLISDSYSALESAPSALLAECRTSSTSSGQILPERIVTSSSSTVSSSLVSQQCGINDGYACVIPAGMTLRMESNLNVSALTVRGKVEWTDATQSSTHQWLCAGFIAVEEGGVFNLEVLSGDLSAWVYIKDNGAMHSVLRTRAFGAVGGNVSEVSTLLNVRGRPLSRTWSLLASPVLPGDQSVFLMHDPVLMGWRLGDRITIAPTKSLSEGQGESFKITSIGPYNEVKLNGVVKEEHISEATLNPSGDQAAIQSAEVVNLTRNIVITGDDFRHIECSNDFSPSPGVDTSTQGCRCAGARTKCTMGLHTIHSMGGISSIQHTRVEKCGQRGVEGKYCLHFHLMQSCPECLFKGNAIEYGHQRGIIVHGTHLSKLEDNVINDVRGAGIYIEDGNEMYNNLNYNVIVCPWRLKDQRKYGCTVPGTDNHEADTAINQSGIFAISAVNNWRGNRAAGSFNGMFIDPNAFGGQGRGAARGKVCPRTELFGRFEGNTFHSHGRFGTYILNMNYPKNTGQNVANNGFVDIANCNAFTSTGDDNGVSVAFVDHVDYQNAFVGQYEAGDIGYVGHTSTDNSNLIYWKETKNFADGCSAHISQGYYRNGNMALPDQGTFIIEETIFDQGIHLEPNHHCNVGVTGVLCMPQYVFHKVTWNGGVGAAGFTPGAWVTFQNMNTQGHNNNQNHGGIFVLSPEDAIANRNRSPGPSIFFFPAGYSSLVSNKFSYLLAIDASTGICALASTLNDAEPGVNGSTLGTRYGGGILCKPELRALKIYSRGLNAGSAPDMLIEVWNGDVNDQVGAPIASQFIPYHQIGGNGQTSKQGYSVPVVPGPTYSYRLSLRGGGDIPAEWIIEFSDPIMSNRFYSDADTLQLVVQGRNCGQSINSRHDRRYIWGGFEYLENSAFGHGACTNYSDMPSISCSNPSVTPAIAATECAEDCAGGCSVNEFCDCGSKSCHCKAGFIGENCDIDLCAAARCSSHGVCSATYLGGDIPVSRQACICEDGWSGPLCDINPCAGKNCSGHGTCKAAGDSDFTCECDAGFSGEICEITCDNYCSGGGGQYPFGCATNLSGVVKYFCNQSGGCAYSSDTSDPGPPGFCAYKTETSGVCECYSQNDCKIADKCDASGICSEETNRPNGTPCNSVPYGKCLAGVCIAGGPSPPTPTPPSPTPPSPSSPSPTVLLCECSSCTQQVLDSFAGDYTCRARIEWLQSPDGGNLSEIEACTIVAHDEFPNECGDCDPFDCGPDPSSAPTNSPLTPLPTQSPILSTPSPCGCHRCTQQVLEIFAGDYTCGARIEWLQSPDGGGLSENDACILVAHNEFPNECGACDPLECAAAPSTFEPTSEPTKFPVTTEPTHSPTLSPVTPEPTPYPSSSPITLSPTQSPVVSSPSPCGCLSCTQQVLDTFAGDYTCGARIKWLQNPDGGDLSENDACILVAHDEFPNECGACDPLDCSIGLLPPSSPPSIPSGSCPVLHWSDEFNGNELDTSKWNILLGDGCSYGICGWGNNELQIYQSENIVVRNGKLTIEARQEGATSGYTSARISTDQKADFDVFGRFEARIRIPIDQGIWPAFWMLPSDWIYGGWPKSGEIDIMENVGDPGLSHGTIHFGDSFHQYQGASIGLPNGESFADDYHVFAVDREENLIRWIMDDVVYLEKTPADIGTNTWPFNERFNFLLNVAVGGTWPGNPDATTTFPQSMDVDYVRVYDNPLPTFLGPRVVKEGESGVSFEVFNGYENSEYYWEVPQGASIVSGQGTDSINVNFGVSGGPIQCTVSSSCGTKQFNVVVRVVSGICGCHTSCSQQVLDTSAGDYTCGERISWLQSPDGGNFSEIEACITIAHDEFPIECGACDPLKCNDLSTNPSSTPTKSTVTPSPTASTMKPTLPPTIVWTEDPTITPVTQNPTEPTTAAPVKSNCISIIQKMTCNTTSGCSWKSGSCSEALVTNQCSKWNGKRKRCKRKGCKWQSNVGQCKGRWG